MHLLHHFVLLAALLQAPVDGDTTRAHGPVRTALGSAPTQQQQQQQKKQLVEYSDAYMTRATIHKYSSYTMLPLFALQYYTGKQLVREANGWKPAPEWVHDVHGPLAISTGVLFTVNTVTGGLNFLEARKDPEDRTRRTMHALLMMAADAGFVATALLVPDGPPPPVPIDPPRPHRTVAIASMSAALLSYAIMLPIFREE
jgi:hypothetical protein